MKAYHNDPAIKQKYLERVQAHRLADEIEKGYYWKNGKGCAVGCTIHGNNHSEYEKELGIPRLLARLEDGIFENLPNERSKFWPEEFLDAINVGADLSDVWPKFAVWLLTDEKFGVLQYAKSEKSKESIKLVADYYARYKEISAEEWKNAAAYAAYAAYANAADAAANAAANAAYVAYANAAYVAYANAAYVAYANAAYVAASAAYAAAANAAAEQKTRIAQADKLLELFRECK